MEGHSMVTGLWGKKIGMTQVFAKDKAVPVTVIDVSDWLVTQLKTESIDGYIAVQVGKLRERFAKQPFSADWIKSPKKYFSLLREVKLKKDGETQELVIGHPVKFHSILSIGDKVDVVGKSKGCGFAGAVKRHGFAGGRASHGSTLGRRPGSLSFMRSQGRVIKGKRLPGHMGNATHRARHLEVVKVYNEENLVLVKGSVPGKSGSLVFIQKA